MLKSSIGFHTLTLFMRLEKEEEKTLIKHFREYSQNTGLIKMYPVKNGKKDLQFEEGKLVFYDKHDLKIIYYDKYRGIEWRICSNNWSRDFKEYTVEVKINPKILGGVNDYITAATYEDMETAISTFNDESSIISEILGNFNLYTIKRIDYCINFDLSELAPMCSPEQIMSLIKRGNIPKHYSEFTEYDNTAHRTKSKDNSFYLTSKSVNINCYIKHMELCERSEKLKSLYLPPVPQETINSAHDIIRFEVQCKYPRTYALSNYAKRDGNNNINKYESLLSRDACTFEINKYYRKIIRKGNWYSLQEAIRIVVFQNFNKQKEKRLINALYDVNHCRSLAKAKGLYQGAELETFKRTLSDLALLNINPVTIPKEWGIKCIPDLLYAFYDKCCDEAVRLDMENWRHQLLEEFFKK